MTIQKQFRHQRPQSFFVQLIERAIGFTLGITTSHPLTRATLLSAEVITVATVVGLTANTTVLSSAAHDLCGFLP